MFASIAVLGRRLRAHLHSTEAAIDLASIMVGVIVISIIASVAVAIVVATVPWAQDRAAQQNLDAVATAESATLVLDGHYVAYDSHPDSEYHAFESASVGLQRPAERLIVQTSECSQAWVAAQRSATGKVFLRMGGNGYECDGATPTPPETPTTAVEGPGFYVIDNPGSINDPTDLPPEVTTALPPGIPATDLPGMINPDPATPYDFGPTHKPGYGLSTAAPAPGNDAAMLNTIITSTSLSNGSGYDYYLEVLSSTGATIIAEDADWTTAYDSEGVTYNGKYYFTATSTSDFTMGLYALDGTDASLVTGSGGLVDAESPVVWNGAIYFVGRTIVDGALKSDIYSFDGSTIEKHQADGLATNDQRLVPMGTKLYYIGYNAAGNGEPELWAFNGTSASMIGAVIPGGGSNSGWAKMNESLIAVDGTLYFVGYTSFTWTAADWNVFAYPGSGVPVASLAIPYPETLYAVGDKMVAFHLGQPVNAFDGMTHTQVTSDPAFSVDVSEAAAANGKLYFTQYNDNTGYDELWRYDGATAESIATFPSFKMYANSVLGVANGNVYLGIQDATHGVELWAFNGTDFVLAAETNPGSASGYPSAVGTVGNRFYFKSMDAYGSYTTYGTDGDPVLFKPSDNDLGHVVKPAGR